MDYYNEVVIRQPEERSWVTYIKGKVMEENNSFPCMVVGKTGSGKSYSVLRLCTEIDPDFQLEGNWFFRADEFMSAFTSYYEDEKNSKRGKIWVFDEAGVDLNSLKYQNSINKAYSSLFQTSRFRNYIFFGTVPFMDFITKQVRKLMQHRMDAHGVEDGKSIIMPRCLDWKEKKEDFYYKRLICIEPDGSQTKINRLLLPLARKSLIDEYEQRRAEFSNSLNAELVQEQRAILEKEKGSNRTILDSPNYQYVLESIKKGITQPEMAAHIGVVPNRIQEMLRIFKKHGYDFKLARKQNHIFYPDKQDWVTYNKESVTNEAKNLNIS